MKPHTIHRCATLRTAAAAAALASALSGCVSNTPALDRQFGQAQQQALRQQILNPAAPASRSVAGVDGEAARSAQQNYQKSFREPVPHAAALAVGVGR